MTGRKSLSAWILRVLGVAPALERHDSAVEADITASQEVQRVCRQGDRRRRTVPVLVDRRQRV